MNFFIDCEFDTPTGSLISLGIISEDGNREFYEVIQHDHIQDEWVKANVIPILEKEPITFVEFQAKLTKFVEQFSGMNIIANHPADILYFNKAIIKEQGKWILIQPLTFEIDDALSGKKSKLLHNAVHDARATREDWLRKNGYV